MAAKPKIRAATLLALAVIAAGCVTSAVRRDGAVAGAVSGSFIDKRDGKTYRTVKIGSQTWMAENLNFATDSSVCHSNADTNCTRYGRLYNWDDAMNACPAAWRVPSEEDWDKLAAAVGGRRDEDGEHWEGAAKKLKSTAGWKYHIPYGSRDSISGNGTDEFGFSALPGNAGWKYRTASSGGFWWRNTGSSSFWWSATEGDTNHAWSRGIYEDSDDLFRNHYRKTASFSLRCVKGAARKKGAAGAAVKIADAAAAIPDTAGATFTDPRDGNTYRTVRIGNLNWMAENLNYDMLASRCMTPGGRGEYEAGCQKYGRYYSWNDAMKACPAGWRVPTDADWDSLAVAVGGRRRERENGRYNWGIAGQKLKTTTGWPDCGGRDGHSLSGNGTDEYGFSAIPGGIDKFYGCVCIHYTDTYSSWWSATKDDTSCVWVREVGCYDGSMSRYCSSFPLRSLRCVEGFTEGKSTAAGTGRIADTVPTADTIVQTAAVTGNGGTFTDARDGNTYRTVKIGTQTWMAENLNFKMKGSYCYKDEESYCQKYGRMYGWEDAMKACPAGWRVPSEEDWDILAVAVGGKLWVDGNQYYWRYAGTRLKSTTGWQDRENGGSGNGTDDFGFSALPLPGGVGWWKIYGWTDNAGKSGSWWSHTGSSRAYVRSVSYEYGYMDWRSDEKYRLISLRCIADSAGLRP